MTSPENKLAIEEYIKSHDECKIPETVPIMLKGKRELLQVYLVPLEYLYYNLKNGRFKAEYLELVRKNGGRELDPIDAKDAKKIQNLLLGLDPIETKRTTLDIGQRGQWNPGIMTHDGFVIDGNRRLSILRVLSEKDKKFNLMKLAWLPPNVDKNDLWKLEAGIQLGKDEIVKYGPINELLKLKEGIDAGLDEQEIAQTLYGYEDTKEITNKLDRLLLIEDFLRFNGTPEKYNEVKNKVEHFINTQKILAYVKDRIDDPGQKKDIKRALFGLIQDGRSHLEIRKVREMFQYNSPKALDWLRRIAEASKPKQLEPQVQTTSEEEIETKLGDEAKKTIDELDKEEIDEDSKSQINTMWLRAVEALKVDKNRDDLPLLLGSALDNLDGIDYTNDQLKNEQCKETIEKILRHAEKLRKALEG